MRGGPPLCGNVCSRFGASRRQPELWFQGGSLLLRNRLACKRVLSAMTGQIWRRMCP